MAGKKRLLDSRYLLSILKFNYLRILKIHNYISLCASDTVMSKQKV
jgi:hypothetical protein